MAGTLRTSPIKFDMEPSATATVNGWQVVTEYKGQKKGPLLIDLSHKPNWDLQSKDLSIFEDSRIPIPIKPNEMIRHHNLFTARMNAIQCSIWSLDNQVPDLDGFKDNITDITDGQALFAIVGRNLPVLMEAFGPLDIFSPEFEDIRLFQSPLFHIPCQILLLERSGDMQVVLISCPRGYGNSMAKALLKSGNPFGLSPGGENIFTQWLEK